MKLSGQQVFELVIAVVSIGLIPFSVWVVSSIYSNEALANKALEKSERVIALEEKIDYIYKYIIEKKK